ncbi:hypothetical protein ScPMuIL_009902 [Solemya velum]
MAAIENKAKTGDCKIELDRVGGTFRIGGKDKGKQKSAYGSRLPSTADAEEPSNGSQYGFAPTQDIISGLSDKEVNEKFEQMLDDMNLTEEKKAPLRNRDDSIKRSMLAMSFKGGKPKGVLSTPQDYLGELKNADLKGEKRLQALESLRVSLSTTSHWVQEFGEKGLNAILRNLTYCCDSKSERRSTYECVRCLKAFMNNKFGLRLIIQHEEALTILSRTVDPTDPNTMLEAVRLLGAICLVPPDGHEKALEGITVCGEIRGRDRFIPIIMGLGMMDNTPMQVACIQLVNALVSTPDDLDFRLHLRNEFMRTGIIDLISKLDTQEDEELKTHLKIFYEHQEEDYDEFSHRYDNVRMELEYPFMTLIIYLLFILICFDLILNSVKDSVAESYLLSMLQHLLCIRDDMFARSQYYKLIEECISQIVLHKNGVDPDFRHTKRFDIDVEPLLSSLTEKAKFEDSELGTGDMSSKLESALTAKQESEAKMMGLEEKVKQYEAEIAGLKGKITDGIGSAISNALTKGGGAPPPPPLPGGGGAPPPPPPPLPGGGGPPPPPPPPLPGGGPPPPPPMPGGGPPPPPPPPGFGPPPPPGFSPAAPSPPVNQLPYGMEPKKKYNVKVKTKRLNWNKINARTLEKNSFWVKVNEEELENEELFKDLLENFSMENKVKPNGDGEPTEKKAISGKKTKELKVLDGKTAQNLSILLGSIKVPYPEIKRRFLEMDEANLSVSIIENLIKLMPEPEQMNQLTSFKDQYKELAEPEQFCVTMCSIKRLTPRLNSTLFKMKFSEMVSDIKPDLVSATEACEEVMQSTKFAKLLELILLIGNYMNTGSRNAQSLGFELSFLGKLQNTKTQDGKMTLMHFLANVVESQYNDMLTFHEELSHVEKAARVSDETIQKNLKTMEKGLSQLEIDIKNFSKNPVEGDRFPNFISSAKEQYDVLNSMYKKMDSLYREMGKFYCFDCKKYTMEELFNDVKNFKEGFQVTLKENIKMRETQEKIRRAKEAKERAEREKQAKMARKKALVDMTIDDDQEGVMDNLLEALKTGSAFNMGREKRKENRRTPRASGAERRAQLSRSRSRQNLLENSTVREISFDESSPGPPVKENEVPAKRERKKNTRAQNEFSEAEQLLMRLKEL